MMIRGFIDQGIVSPRREQYQSWIDEHTPDNPHGLCRMLAEMMIVRFPELRIVGCMTGSLGTGHCWCVDHEDFVIDPSAHQYADYGVEIRGRDGRLEVAEMPIGRCLNCGELVYQDAPSSQICSQACADAFHYSLL